MTHLSYVIWSSYKKSPSFVEICRGRFLVSTAAFERGTMELPFDTPQGI